MTTPQQNHFDLMCRLHKVTCDLTAHLRFDKKHPWHLHLVSLYGTILESCGAACLLIRSGSAIGVPMLLRSAVEANLDFVNLAKDRRYGYYMRAAELREWVKILEEAKKGQNPFLASIAEVPNLDQVLAQWRVERSKLSAEGFSPLSQKSKFQKSNLEAVYRSVYNFLCCHSHNNIRALVTRHVTISSDQKDFSVEFFSPVDLDALLPYIDSFCGIVVSSTETIHGILQSDAKDKVTEMQGWLAAHRKKLLTEEAAPGYDSACESS